MTEILTNTADKELAAACEMNMRDWYLNKINEGAGQVHKGGKTVWSITKLPSLYHGVGMDIPFPNFTDAGADQLIKKMLLLYRRKKISPWATIGKTSTPKHVRQQLRAWGFVYRFLNFGMACDLSRLKTSKRKPKGVNIELIEDGDIFKKFAHPTYGKLETDLRRTAVQVNMQLAKKRPKCFWNFLATSNGTPVGYIVLLAGSGVAGLYDFGVIQSVRQRSVGTYLFGYACQRARDLGFKAAVLQNRPNLTPFFKKFGFRPVTHIEYWNYPRSLLSEPLPTLRQRKLKIRKGYTVIEEFQIAVNSGRERDAVKILNKSPSIAFRQIPGTGNITALHLAALHGYRKLVKALINLGADLEARDTNDGGTPLTWAIYACGRKGPVIKRNQIGAAEEILQAGVNINASNRWNNTPLKIAEKDCPDSVQKLLKKYGAK